MANSAQAKKRARQAEARRARNAAQRTQLSTAIKKVRLAIASSDKAKAQEAYRHATSVIDRMADKGIIHKNAAARRKSTLNKALKALVTKAA